MQALHYSLDRVGAVKRSIDLLKGIEFPYGHSSDALDKVEEVFAKLDLYLRTAKGQGNPVDSLCAESLRKCFEFLPLLGFILRSTNVRNAFELHGPLLRVARRLLGPETKMVISSEWDQSPFIYADIPEMQDFVLVGFPATDSSNPLLVPLAGHELGHGIWLKRDLARAYRDELLQTIIATIIDDQSYRSKFAKLYEYDESDINLSFWSDIEHLSILGFAHEWAKAQAQESFCDLIGVGLFGSAFMDAFAYLLSPGEVSRYPFYPSTRTRFRHMLEHARVFGFTMDKEYYELFTVESQAAGFDDKAQLQLQLADLAVESIIGKLTLNAKEILDELHFSPPDPSNVQSIMARFRLRTPAIHANNIGNILAAGWQAYHDPGLWNKSMSADDARRTERLKEIVLKSIEILDIEERQQEQINR
jgi:hypothetical protein